VSDAINNLRERIPEERTRLLEALVESTSDAIIGLDAEHNVVSWNAGAQSMLGYKAEEIVGRSASALVAPERRDRAQENREYLARGGTLSNYETELLRKDGQRVHVSLSSSHLKDEAGVSIGYVTVARDLTESKRAEEALRDTENKLLALYESGVVGVAMGEGDLILNANDALLEMLGYEREELESEGLNWRKITPLEDHYRDEIVLRHALRQGYIEPFEKEYVRKDGSRVPVIVGGRYYAGEPPRFVYFVLDIYQRKRAERALRESEARYRSLVEATAAIVWRATGDGEILDAPLWTEFTGQTEDEYRGSGWLDALHPEDRERIHEAWRRALDKGEPVQGEYRLRHRRHGYRWVAARGVPILEVEGQIREWVGTVIDVHDRKEAEEERERLLARERRISRTLQRSLLPPSLPKIPGAEIAARYLAAGEGLEVGGDFYDAFGLSESSWALVVGDVAGKGPEAAAMTSLAHYTVRAAAARSEGPETVLHILNEEILRQTDHGRFFTVVYGELELGKAGGATLRVAAGGHPPPILIRRNGEAESLPPMGMVLGATPKVEIGKWEAQLYQGDAVVFYTDGVTEARSPGGEFFSEQGLKALCTRCAGLSAEEIAEKVERGVMKFQRGELRDDIALLVLRII
jgi:PAS domain S-box-containing protein